MGYRLFVCVEIVCRIVCGCGDVYNKAAARHGHTDTKGTSMGAYTYKTTGKIINGNYIDAPMISGKSVDVPTGEIVVLNVNGETLQRTVYERIRCGSGKVRARFVIVNGVNYEIA